MNGMTETHTRILTDHGFRRVSDIGHIQVWVKHFSENDLVLDVWIDGKFGSASAHSDCSAVDHRGYYRTMPAGGDFEAFIADAVAAH